MLQPSISHRLGAYRSSTATMTSCCVFTGAAARTPPAFLEGEGKGQGAWVHDRFLVDLIGAGLATAQTERAVAGGRSMRVSRMRITDAGRRALAELRWP